MQTTLNRLTFVSYLVLASTLSLLANNLVYADTDAAQGKVQDKMFKDLDANSDGIITRNEANAFRAKRFEQMDENGDGQLSSEEMKAGYRKMNNGASSLRDSSRQQ